MALTLTVVLLPAQAMAGPTQETELGSGPDTWNDVRIRPNTGLAPASRRTIDLRGLHVTETEKGPQFDVRVKRVVTDGRFDQYFFVYLDFGEGVGFFKIYASTLKGRGGYDSPGDFASCKVKASVSDDEQWLTVVLPWDCTPDVVADVRAFTYTTPLGRQGGSKLYSTDRMKLAEPVDLTQQDSP